MTDTNVHHEESDVNIRAIFGFAIGLIVVAAVIHVVIWVLFRYFADREAAGMARQYPMGASQSTRLPPQPRLQTNPRQDLQDLRRIEEEVLNSYRWVDRNNGIVRIPIKDAMRLTLERGLPSRPPQGQAKP